MRTLIILLLALISATAIAEPAKKAAARHRRAANTAFEVSDYTRAIEEYKKAYELIPDPRLFYNLGLSHMKRYELSRQREDLVQARDYFNRFLGLMQPESVKASARKKLAQLRRTTRDHLDKLAMLAEQAPVSTSTIAVAPPPPLAPPPPAPPPALEPPAVQLEEPKVEPAPFPTWAVLFGVAGATAISAIVTGALAIDGSNSAYDAALANDFAVANDRGDRARRLGYATDGLLVGTVILAGAGLWLLLD